MRRKDLYMNQPFATLWLCVLYLCAAGASALPRDSSPIPRTIIVESGSLPLWVDASSAVDADGKPNTILLGMSANRLQEIIASPLVNGCHEVGPVYFTFANPRPHNTIGQSIAAAKHSSACPRDRESIWFLWRDTRATASLQPDESVRPAAPDILSRLLRVHANRTVLRREYRNLQERHQVCRTAGNRRRSISSPRRPTWQL